MGIVNSKATLFSRRVFTALLTGAGLRSVFAAEPPASERLTWGLEEHPTLNLERRYRADAQVLVMGIPLLRRAGVGGGVVLWREFEQRGRACVLEFSGYSIPEHAAGLNRLGFIREVRRMQPEGGVESIYFGLMTASAEENAEEARRALHSTAKQQNYSVIDGRITANQTQATVAHFAAASGEHRTHLMELAREAIGGGTGVSQSVPREATGTFLHTLAALVARGGPAEGRYSYSNRIYRMQITPAADPKATESFRQRGLMGSDAKAIRVAGRVRCETGGKESEFRIWVPSPAEHPLPLRIEYQAKPYLRLVFEVESA